MTIDPNSLGQKIAQQGNLNLRDAEPWKRNFFQQDWGRALPRGRETQIKDHQKILTGAIDKLNAQNAEIVGIQQAAANSTDDALKAATTTRVADLGKHAEVLKADALLKAQDVGLRQGRVDASFYEMRRALGERVGLDTSKWAPPKSHLSGDKLTRHLNDVATRDAGVFQRIASKPMRIVANHPGAALFVGTAGLIMVGAGMLRNHQEKRAAQDAEMQQMMLQQQMMAAQAPQQISYKNTVNPAEYAMMEERMRAGGNGQSLADAEMQRRAAMQQAAAGAGAQ